MSKTTGKEKTKVDASDSPTYWLKPEQINAMRNATVEHSARYLQARNDAMLAVLADTGLRVNELRQLDVSMIDFEDDVLNIPASIQKGCNEDGGGPDAATIGLAGDTTRTLRMYINHRWKPEPDALFPSRSADRISTQGIRDVVSDAAENAEVKPRSPEGRGSPDDVTPHTLRHSVFYRMVRREDEQIIKVTKRLRHASRDTTEAYYAHMDVV